MWTSLKSCICLITLILLGLSCNTSKKELPFLSYKLDTKGNKTNYKVTYDNHFENQKGDVFTDNVLKDKVFIANFFFTRCPSICPPMKIQLTGLAKEFLEEDNFMIISHTIDPYFDNPDVLNTYAQSTGIPNEKWSFLTASEEHTKNVASQYKTNFKPNEAGTDFYHSSYAALVDQDRFIRGFYDLAIPNEVELLKTDIRVLLRN